jgi:hypothetical protein
MWRVYLEVNWLPVDALVATSNARSLCLNLPLNLCKIIPPPSGHVMKLCPVLLCCNACRCVWYACLIVVRFVLSFGGYIDELQDKGATSDYAASPG